MKAITIKQPWAQLICQGTKDIENRTWPCPKKYIGERVLIHASKAWTKENAEICINNAHVKDALVDLDLLYDYKDEDVGYKGYSFNLPTGVIIGSVEIVDCVINHSSIWAEKTHVWNWLKGKPEEKENIKPIYNWVLAYPILFPEPIPAKGKLNFWEYSNILAEPEED